MHWKSILYAPNKLQTEISLVKLSNSRLPDWVELWKRSIPRCQWKLRAFDLTKNWFLTRDLACPALAPAVTRRLVDDRTIIDHKLQTVKSQKKIGSQFELQSSLSFRSRFATQSREIISQFIANFHFQGRCETSCQSGQQRNLKVNELK